MAREPYDPNNIFDQLAAMSEAAFIASMINGLPEGTTKDIFIATLEVCGKYGIKGLDAVKFVNELSSIFSSIDGISGDDDG